LLEYSQLTLFRQESIDHKRRKLHGEAILVQPVSFFAITAVMFVVVMALVFVLMRGEYKRKDTMPKLLTVYLAPAGGVLTRTQAKPTPPINGRRGVSPRPLYGNLQGERHVT